MITEEDRLRARQLLSNHLASFYHSQKHTDDFLPLRTVTQRLNAQKWHGPNALAPSPNAIRVRSCGSGDGNGKAKPERLF